MKELRKKRTKQLAVWTLLWTLSMALGTFGPKYIWDNNNLLTILGIALSFALGIGMILANRRIVVEGDELERTIQLESMGITLGLAVVVGLSYSMLYTTKLLSGHAEIANLVIFIGLTYLVSSVINTKKYR